MENKPLISIIIPIYKAEKYLKNKETTKENMAKAYRYLIGRGFSYEVATFA